MSVPVGPTARCWRPARSCASTGPGSAPTICASSTACCATRRAPTTTASPSPPWPTRAAGTRPTRSRSAPSTPASSAASAHIDPTDGGYAHRYSLSARWNETDADGATRVNAYVVKSDLALFNNFTYFLNNPIDGDQFKQSDDRLIGRRQRQPDVLRHRSRRPQERDHDRRADALRRIQVGLFNTKDRVSPLDRARRPGRRSSASACSASSTLRWTPWFRTIVGLRARHLHRRRGEQPRRQLAARPGHDRRAPS